MKANKKTVSRLLLLGLTACCGFFVFNQFNQKAIPLYADGDSSSETKKTYSAADFADEVEVDGEELDASLIQSTTTSTSQSLDFSFVSKTFVGFTSGRNDFIVNVFDPNYTGSTDISKASPVPEDYAGETVVVYEGTEDEQTLPLLEGEIMFINTSNATYRKVTPSIKEMYIPEIMVHSLGEFAVKITTISSHCITAAGTEYVGSNGNNSWFNNDGSLKFNILHIPETIERIAADAFIGVPAYDGADPKTDIHITYEGETIPAGFEPGWTDMAADRIVLGKYCDLDRDQETVDGYRQTGVGAKVEDIEDEHGRPVSFAFGCTKESAQGTLDTDGKTFIPAAENSKKDYPLVVEYDKITEVNGVEHRETVFEELEMTNTTDSPYDSVGMVSALTYGRSLSIKLNSGEKIDDNSIVFHNVLKFANGVNINTAKRYFVKPVISYKDKLDLSKLVTYKASDVSTFAGYSMFSLRMNKTLDIVSEKYPEKHSLYQDVKTDIYEQNKSRIESGVTVIRYSLYNLYLSKYHFIYEGSNGALKEVYVNFPTVISYQTLDNDADNKVSFILENSKVAPDFSAEKVRTFELIDISIQMDLFTTSDSGSQTVLGKSDIKYKFACITVFEDEKVSVFNYNIFLIILFLAYSVLFAVAAFILYKVMKEKFKNDEFRRVNDKKYLKQAILFGAGSLVIVAAITFICMRAGGFANTIVAFNPTDPLLIIFAIAGLIIGGYFIVLAVKAVKAEQERRRAIRLKLNEDVDDDGTK